MPGASATANAAACANRFDDPMTNVSKTYLGLSLACRTLPASPLEETPMMAGAGSSERQEQVEPGVPQESRIQIAYGVGAAAQPAARLVPEGHQGLE